MSLSFFNSRLGVGLTDQSDKVRVRPQQGDVGHGMKSEANVKCFYVISSRSSLEHGKGLGREMPPQTTAVMEGKAEKSSSAGPMKAFFTAGPSGGR